MSLISIFITLILYSMSIICFSNHRHHRQHLQIYWNSSNRLFHSSEYLTVYLGDLLDFICPFYDDEQLNSHIEYNTLYLVNENDYYHCNTTNYIPLIKCNKPFDTQRLIYTLSVSNYLPYPHLPEFQDGHYYYFISTSSGQFDGLDQRFDGLCYTQNMKLTLHVQKYSRHAYDQRRKSSKLILAKRSNFTLISSTKRPFSFASRNSPLFYLLLVLCLLTKSKI
ncbi:hypothetical protein I4U23_030163 [Adineta vaga]|nr:hypothetical protein I4U23_030163 [Adineta vaga]